MCPLRLILIFLSASLAGFFVLRNLKNQPHDLTAAADDIAGEDDQSVESSSSSSSSKVCSAIGSIFWTCVDMASGRYLWRQLTNSAPKRVD